MNPLLFTLISRDTPLKRTGATHGGEYSAPCPLDCYQGRLSGRGLLKGQGLLKGHDHFKFWENAGGGEGRWACLGPKAGRSGCDKGGDAIQYLRERDGIGYREACERLHITPKRNFQEASGANTLPPSVTSAGCFLEVERPHPKPLLPPNPTWQAHANGHASRCAALLWCDAGAQARAYLYRRGLFDAVLHTFHVGYNPQDAWEDHTQWGLTRSDQGAKHIWLPRGITFPWYAGGDLWRLNIRRGLTAARPPPANPSTSALPALPMPSTMPARSHPAWAPCGPCSWSRARSTP